MDDPMKLPVQMTMVTHFDTGVGETYIILVYAAREEVEAAIITYNDDPSIREDRTLAEYLEYMFTPAPYEYIDAETIDNGEIRIAGGGE